MDVTSVRWRKARKSGGNGGGCVEVGTDGRIPLVHVRDTTSRERGMLTVDAATFGALLDSAKAGRLDLPRLSKARMNPQRYRQRWGFTTKWERRVESKKGKKICYY